MLKRYVVLEVIKIFFVALLVTLLLMTVAGAAKEGLRNGLPIRLILMSSPFFLPEMLQFTIPGCILFAVCTVFGRMSASNEIVAIKSLGINPIHLVMPVLALSLVLTIFSYFNADVCAWWARPNFKRLVFESVDQIAYGVLKSSHSFSANGVSFVVSKVSGRRLHDAYIVIDGDDSTPQVSLSAQEARLFFDRTGPSLHLECRNGQLEVEGFGKLTFEDWIVREIPLTDPGEIPLTQFRPSELAMSRIPELITDSKGVVKALEQDISRMISEGQDVSEFLKKLKYDKTRLYRLRLEGPRRLANAFACLCFVLIGAPVAVMMKSSDNMSVFFLCFLPILLIYYPLLVLGETVARKGFYPELSIWTADMALLLIGSTLLIRMIKK